MSLGTYSNLSYLDLFGGLMGMWELNNAFKTKKKKLLIKNFRVLLTLGALPLYDIKGIHVNPAPHQNSWNMIPSNLNAWKCNYFYVWFVEESN